jgi:hypothetical protein
MRSLYGEEGFGTLYDKAICHALASRNGSKRGQTLPTEMIASLASYFSSE